MEAALLCWFGSAVVCAAWVARDARGQVAWTLTALLLGSIGLSLYLAAGRERRTGARPATGSTLHLVAAAVLAIAAAVALPTTGAIAAATGAGFGLSYAWSLRAPIKRRRRAAGALTRREREVTALAAGGRSNAEIAAQLEISVRTVESHLYHAMVKLGVGRRGDLAGTASQYGDRRIPVVGTDAPARYR